MKEFRPAVVGIGATGSVLAASLLTQYPHATLVVSRPSAADRLREQGIEVSGALTFKVPVCHVVSGFQALRDAEPNLIFLCTKAFNLAPLLEDLRAVVRPGSAAVVSCHNGLGTEDRVAEVFGAASAFRMSLNYGAALKGTGRSEVAFSNPPNPLGSLTEDNREQGTQIAKFLTTGGLSTEYVDDIKRFVWKKMVLKCTMASICAVADMTIQEALHYPPTREIADGCFQEALSVAKAMGYDLGDDFLSQGIAYLEKVGVHKDSMCHDIEAGRPTEIEVLGGKVVEYAQAKGVSTPFYVAMTNMVRAVEKGARARVQKDL